MTDTYTDGKRNQLFLEDGRIIALTTQDAEPVLDSNAVGRNGDPKRGDWGRPVAEIPHTIVLKWLYEEHERGNTSLKFPSPEFTKIMVEKVRAEFTYLGCQPEGTYNYVGWNK